MLQPENKESLLADKLLGPVCGVCGSRHNPPDCMPWFFDADCPEDTVFFVNLHEFKAFKISG